MERLGSPRARASLGAGGGGSVGTHYAVPSPASALATVGDSSCAGALGVLQAAASPAEQERLVGQAAELRRECRRLALEGAASEDLLEKQGRELEDCNHACGVLGQATQRLLSELARNGDAAAEARREGELWGQEAAALRGRLMRTEHCEADLQQRLDHLLQAMDGVAGERSQLEIRSGGASEELEFLQSKLARASASLQRAERGGTTRADLARRGLEAQRRRAQEAACEAHAAEADAERGAAGLVLAEEEHATLSEQLLDARSRALSEQASISQRALWLQERFQSLAAEATRCDEEARSSTEARLELEELRTDVEVTHVRLQYCRGIEEELREQLLREREGCEAEAHSAAQSLLRARTLEERRIAEAAAARLERERLEATAEGERRGLRADVSRARDAVAAAGRSLEAIRTELVELQGFNQKLEGSELITQKVATELVEETEAQEAAHSEVLSRLRAVSAACALLEQQADVASADGEEELLEAERGRVSLLWELGRAELEHQEADAERGRRASLERQLRQALEAAEATWQAVHDRMEEENVDLARKALRLDGQRRGAEEALRGLEVELEGALAAESEERRMEASALAAAEASELAASAPLQAEARRLRREVEELRAAGEGARLAARRAGALNEGLRAQLGVLQRREAAAEPRAGSAWARQPPARPFGAGR